MADIFFSPFLQVILDRLASPVTQMIGDSWDLKGNIQKLQVLLPRIQALLDDAEEQQVSNEAVRIWLSDLKDAAYNAEDLLDEYEAKIFPTFSVLKDPSLMSIHGDKVRKMLEALEMTAAEGLTLPLTGGRGVDKQSDKRETGSLFIESEVFGRREDKEKIITRLLDGDASFIPIIGLGGIGKTTLAQLAYSDARVTRHFDIKFWVFVSDDFTVKKIMKDIIASATKRPCDFSELDVLQSELWGLLHKKRYLLVLDDVWSEDQNEWDKLRPSLRGGEDGSKIIVTSRSKRVAELLDSLTPPYYLEGLPEEDCWSLFKQQANFDRGEEHEHPNLVTIGKNIVKKCGGVPLAAKSLGGSMRFTREERRWLIVQKSQFWNLGGSQSGILPALRLSYRHLHPRLRNCLEFCSIFPKNYEFKKEKLIYMWMAERLIQSNEGGKQPEDIEQPEDIGNEYFNDLLCISFFQVADNCNNDGTTGYKMHGIIHDLAQSIAGKRSLILDHGLQPSGLQPSSLEAVRRSSVASDFRASSTIPEALYEAEHLRTLLLFPGGDFIKDPLAMSPLISRFKCLRVLDLNGCGFTTLDESIENLRLLRYLDLSYTRLEMLPAAITKLGFLQTLNLFNCYKLVKLPHFAPMNNLRHLIVTGCEALTTMMPSEFSFGLQTFSEKAFNQLQILPVCIIGVRDDLRLLGCASNLRGELKIKGLENMETLAEGRAFLRLSPLCRRSMFCGSHVTSAAEEAKLGEKENLESLGLYWGKNDDDLYLNMAGFQERTQWHTSRPPQSHEPSSGSSQGHEPDATLGEKVIEGLRPHQNLQQLFVKGYPGISFPDWRLPKLIVVELSNFKNCQALPVLGDLLLLKTLKLSGMEAVQGIDMEFYGQSTERPFPSLQELDLRGFPNLAEWVNTNDGVAFPKLRKVIISKCPNLTTVPLFQSLQHLELRDCNQMILKSTENLKYLSLLAIEKVPDLYHLSGGLLVNSSLFKSLEIISCPSLRLLPIELGNLTALKSLTIRLCQELFSLPGLQNLKALESLEICDCHNLISMPNDAIGGLSSLRTLSIQNCRKLTSLSSSFQHLTSLEHLTIMFCPSLDSLPEGVQQLSALRSWTILSCPEFLCLPEGLQHLTTLQSLEIGFCHGLTVLPEWMGRLASLRTLSISDCKNLKYLPEGLKALSGLQHLSIQDCPELEERCKPEIGEDWPKIAHIPYQRIGTPVHNQSSIASSSASSSR